MTMTKFSVPTKEEVSEDNKVLFDKLKNAVGFVPSFVRINFCCGLFANPPLSLFIFHSGIDKIRADAVNIF